MFWRNSGNIANYVSTFTRDAPSVHLPLRASRHGKVDLDPSPTAEELGPLLETLVLHELRAFLSYTGRDYPLYFWRTYDGAEVDFVFETSDGFVAIEVKSAKRWDKRFHRGLRRLREHLGADRVRCFGLYLGERSALWEDVRVTPVLEFLRQLWGETVL